MRSWFKPDIYLYHEEEVVLKSLELPPLDCYLRNWSTLIMDVTAVVPRDRLLVVKTNEIGQRLSDIETFMNIPLGSLDGDKAHLYKSKSKLEILSQMDEAHVNRRVEANCGFLVKHYFGDEYGLS